MTCTYEYINNWLKANLSEERYEHSLGTAECARELASRLRGINCHVNLIPLNSVEERNLNGVSRKYAYQFQGWLESLHISATVRRELGTDIDGACGQLRNKFSEQRAGENE